MQSVFLFCFVSSIIAFNRLVHVHAFDLEALKHSGERALSACLHVCLVRISKQSSFVSPCSDAPASEGHDRGTLSVAAACCRIAEMSIGQLYRFGP